MKNNPEIKRKKIFGGKQDPESYLFFTKILKLSRSPKINKHFAIFCIILKRYVIEDLIPNREVKGIKGIKYSQGVVDHRTSATE